MNATNPTSETGLFKPAAILVVDFVKFSIMDKVLKHTVLKAMEEIFHKAVSSLKLEDVHFNYTGDGYFCAFLGNSSARILDFINYTIPELNSRLAGHHQQLRAGLDFGLIKLKSNALTDSVEVIGFPGILATRLEEAAEANKILCSETAYNIFIHSHSEMFSKKPFVIKTKDREILAYEILPLDSNELQNTLLNLIYQTPPTLSKTSAESGKILIIDDEAWLLEMIRLALQQKFPNYEIVTELNSATALELYQSDEFALVITDINMGRIDGYMVTDFILKKNPRQPIIVMTGLADNAGERYSFELGAFDYLAKPFTTDVLYAVVENAISNLETFEARKRLALLSDEPGLMFMQTQQIAKRLNTILHRTKSSNDIANTMLRHKAKQVVRDFVRRLRPGNDVLKGLGIIKTQLECVERLSANIGKIRLGELEKFVKTYAKDLRTMYSKISIKLSWKNSKPKIEKLPFEPVIVLIISELLDNAISAMNGVGKITTKISILKAANILQVEIHDTGPGIPAALRERVFNEGFSTKGEGRGLGLWLIREAARSLKGDVLYDYDNGARFSVRVPLS
jgi:DNA-binding response OmpR family regulator/anti-sigma regulatory factor (Ser/Thr protein kinase)